MPLRGVRGAIDVNENTSVEIRSATINLLTEIIACNPTIEIEDICSVLFTVTEDLNSLFPAEAARELGWNNVPLLCARELSVPGSLPKCIRVLIHWNTDLKQSEISHVYLGKAEKLRPDLTNNKL
jgi:chorismate mutase